MSGEVDARPNLREEFKALRDRLNELERRVSGDDQGLDLSDINDVRVDSLGDGTITLSDGSALIYRASDRLWVPGASASAPGAASGAYADSPVDTSVPDNTITPLTWPAFVQGTDVLDLTDPDEPVVLADGVYTLNANVLITANSPTPTVNVDLVAVATDVPASFQGAGGGGSFSSYSLSAHVTSFLHAGSSLQVFATQASGGAVDIQLIRTTVTWINATEGTP